MKRSIVYILSTNHAGSHLLSLMLGSHSRAAHLGELSRVIRPREWKPLCGRCSDARSCPVFGGIDGVELSELYPKLFENVGDDVQMLVDNSKKLRWAERFLGEGRFERKYVHLIRDPRALMRRWSLHNMRRERGLRMRYRLLRRRPDLAVPGVVLPGRRFFLYKWLAENQAITRFVARHGLDAHVLTYRDLTDRSSPALERLVDWLGLPYEKEQREYWNFEHHGSEKPRYDWVKQDRVEFVDVRWREFLTAEEQAWALGHRRVARYLEGLGLRYVEDGLTAGR